MTAQLTDTGEIDMGSVKDLKLPPPDTHCLDDEGVRPIDVWSYSPELVRQIIAADRAMQAAEIERLRADADQMLETLTGIRNANPREWEELSCEFTEFERWAKARANHSILKNAAMKETP